MSGKFYIRLMTKHIIKNRTTTKWLSFKKWLCIDKSYSSIDKYGLYFHIMMKYTVATPKSIYSKISILPYVISNDINIMNNK